MVGICTSAPGIKPQQYRLKVIRAGNYATWPHLPAAAVRKHFPESDETWQQGIRSTKQRNTEEVVQDNGSIKTVPLKKHCHDFVCIDKAKEMLYTNQTGAFPIWSKRDHCYIMIMYKIDSNAIRSASMRDRTVSKIVCPYQELITKLKEAGLMTK